MDVRQLLRWGASALFMVGVAVHADAWVMMSASVMPSTCELKAGNGVALDVGRFNLSDFSRNAGVIPGRNAFSLYFPDVGCRRSAFGAGNPLVLFVNGPVATGSGRRAWGSHHDDMAYGIRLQYQQAGRLGRITLSPASNRLVVSQPGKHRYYVDETDFTLVMRPEMSSWNYTRIKNGATLAVPLVFSVAYQ